MSRNPGILVSIMKNWLFYQGASYSSPFCLPGPTQSD